MPLPLAFGVAQAAKLHYNPHARRTGQPLWSEDIEDAVDWWRDPAPLRTLLAALSPLPRPEAEEVLLQQLAESLVTGKLPHDADPDTREALIQADLTERQAVLTQLVSVIDWPRHHGIGNPHQPKSLAFHLLDRAIGEGSFDMAFPVLEPHMVPTDQPGRHGLVLSILYESEAGNPMAQRIRTPLKDLTTPDMRDHLTLWGMLKLTGDEPQQHGALATADLMDFSRPFAAKAFRDHERAVILANRGDTEEIKAKLLDALDVGLEGMLTHPWLAEHHDALYDAFRALRPHVAEAYFLAEERQETGQRQPPEATRAHRRRRS